MKTQDKKKALRKKLDINVRLSKASIPASDL